MSSTGSTYSTMFSTAGSVVAFIMLLPTLTTFIRKVFKDYITLWICKLLNFFKSPKLTIIIPNYDGLVKNEVYEAAEIYLGEKINPTIMVTVENGAEVFDVYDNMEFSWRRVHEKLDKYIVQNSENLKSIHQQPETRYFHLTFDAKNKNKVLESYVPYVYNKEKLDPALLRPGRMNMHIHLSYCTPSVFDVLAFNYLKINHHPLFEDIKQLIEKVEVTPADVAERLMKNNTSDVALQELLDFLESKKIQQDEARAKETQEQEKQIEDKENKSSQDDGVKVNE